MALFDRRLHPVRSDLAAKAYEGRVEAPRFADGAAKRVVADMAALRREPRADCFVDTQALFGETFTVYEETSEGWAWGQLATDTYVGWIAASALSSTRLEPTHRVAALRSYRYPFAELKSPSLGLLSIGALVSVRSSQTVRGLDYAILEDGSAMVAKHLVPLDHRVADWVSVAEALTGTPYLWGGRTSLGLDCSSLVQLAAQAGGIDAPRDSDMQEMALGELLNHATGLPNLQRGNLIFWKGHVGIMRDSQTMIHANGFSMAVTSELLAEAIARIKAREGSDVTAVRRLAVG